MFGKSEVAKLLESEINLALLKLKALDPSSDEYQKLLDRIVVLHRMKEEEKSRFGSRDNLAVVVGNLLGIIMVIKHEAVGNVITSRAFQLLLKPITRT